MTEPEFTTFFNDVAARWPNVERWGSNQRAALFIDIGSFSLGTARQAMRKLQGEVTGTLNPQHIVKAVREEIRSNREADLVRPDPTRCQHPRWGIIEEADDGARLGICAICCTEKWFVKDALLTPLENAEAQKQRQAAKWEVPA